MPCRDETGFKLIKHLTPLETKELIPPCLLRPLSYIFLGKRDKCIKQLFF